MNKIAKFEKIIQTSSDKKEEVEAFIIADDIMYILMILPHAIQRSSLPSATQ